MADAIPSFRASKSPGDVAGTTRSILADVGRAGGKRIVGGTVTDERARNTDDKQYVVIASGGLPHIDEQKQDNAVEAFTLRR